MLHLDESCNAYNISRDFLLLHSVERCSSTKICKPDESCVSAKNDKCCIQMRFAIHTRLAGVAFQLRVTDVAIQTRVALQTESQVLRSDKKCNADNCRRLQSRQESQVVNVTVGLQALQSR